MKLELARQNDFETIIAFYDDVMERTPEMGTYARWQKGITNHLPVYHCHYPGIFLLNGLDASAEVLSTPVL